MWFSLQTFPLLNFLTTVFQRQYFTQMCLCIYLYEVTDDQVAPENVDIPSGQIGSELHFGVWNVCNTVLSTKMTKTIRVLFRKPQVCGCLKIILQQCWNIEESQQTRIKANFYYNCFVVSVCYKQLLNKLRARRETYNSPNVTFQPIFIQRI